MYHDTDVETCNGDEKDCWDSIDEDGGAGDHDQVLEAEDQVDDQLLPFLEREFPFVMFFCHPSFCQLSPCLSLFILVCMHKDVVVNVDVADPIKEGLVIDLEVAHFTGRV